MPLIERRSRVRRPGFPKSRSYDWKQREEQELEEDLVSGAQVSPYAILPEEKEAVIEYDRTPPPPDLHRFERTPYLFAVAS